MHIHPHCTNDKLICVNTKSCTITKVSSQMSTYFWQNTCFPSSPYSTSLSSHHIQNYETETRWIKTKISFYQTPAGLSQKSNKWKQKGYLPFWPDCVIVQDAYLMHLPTTIHTFNKPDERDRGEDTA